MNIKKTIARIIVVSPLIGLSIWVGIVDGWKKCLTMWLWAVGITILFAIYFWAGMEIGKKN